MPWYAIAASGHMVRVRFGRTDLGYAVRGLLYGDAALRLPQWFKAAASGSYDRFAQAYVDRARALDGEIADGVHLGVYCAEDLPRVDWPAAIAAARPTHLGTYLIDADRAACAVWPRGIVPSSVLRTGPQPYTHPAPDRPSRSGDAAAHRHGRGPDARGITHSPLALRRPRL